MSFLENGALPCRPKTAEMREDVTLCLYEPTCRRWRSAAPAWPGSLSSARLSERVHRAS